MLRIKNEGIILKSNNLDFEKKGVFNPTCIIEAGTTHMFYRAVDLQDMSRIGYAEINGNRVVKRLDHPVLEPKESYEIKGIEDPRLTKLNDTYFMVYVALDSLANARLAMAESRNLQQWKKVGLVGPNITYREAKTIIDPSLSNKGYGYFLDYFSKYDDTVFLYEKSGCILPQKISGKTALIHRIHPGIQIAYARDISEFKENRFWREQLASLSNFIVMSPQLPWEGEVIGMGSVPIQTNEGWLVIYYSSKKNRKDRVFRVGAALLDPEDPRKEIGRTKQPLFEPLEEWEKIGRVPNVVFPSGAIIKDERVWIYYGAADTLVAAKSVELEDLLLEIKKR